MGNAFTASEHSQLQLVAQWWIKNIYPTRTHGFEDVEIGVHKVHRAYNQGDEFFIQTLQGLVSKNSL